MPKRLGTSMLANQRKKSRYRNVTTQNLRSLIPRGMVPETHYRDYFGVSNSTPSADTFMICNVSSVPLGVGVGQRTGDRIFMKTLDITMQTRYSGRLSVLIPKDPTVLPTALDFTARYDHGDFTILHDAVVNCNDSSSDVQVTLRRLKIPLNMERVFRSNTDVVSKNNIIVVFNSATAQLTTGRIQTRLYFTG